jgi:hypothetical protein
VHSLGVVTKPNDKLKNVVVAGYGLGVGVGLPRGVDTALPRTTPVVLPEFVDLTLEPLGGVGVPRAWYFRGVGVGLTPTV